MKPLAVRTCPLTSTLTAAEIREYMSLVYQAVARFLGRVPPNVLREDLVAAGTFGLIDSLRKNGAERGQKFEWYARIRIRGAIVDELRAQDWLTRRARFHATVQQSARGSVPPSSACSAVVGFDDLPKGIPTGGALEAPRTPHDLVEQAFDHRALASALETLPERERRIVKMHYFQGAQFKTIAEEMGVSEPRISQLHSRAVSLLRTALERAAA
jgi:RNA polymerase sigma factor for flagellar operon FliA